MSLKSPKFFLREKLIAAIVSKPRLIDTWKKKTFTDFRNFFLPDPIDYLDKEINIESISSSIVKRISSGEYAVSGTKRYLVEKSKGLCRQMTLPSLEDALILQCLADAYWSDIKSKSPSKNAFFEPKDHTFSKNNKMEPEYGSVKSWLDFQKEILGFAAESNFVVITDIANYYDFIDFAQLRNVIVSTISIREPVIDFLMYILGGMCWRPDYMPSREVGMPQIDIDAPRLLAHSFLFELDAMVEQFAVKNYARFMDDIDVGVNTIAEAKNIVKSIDLTLQTRQLRLNSGKTQILTKMEAHEHFKVSENKILDRINRLILSGDNTTAAARVKKIYLKWSNNNRSFNTGNGEKIFKRIVSYAGIVGEQIDRQYLYSALKLKPNMRQPIFKYLGKAGINHVDIIAFSELIRSGYICDDYCIIEMAKCVFHANINQNKKTIKEIENLIDILNVESYYELYAYLIITTRFQKFGKTIEVILKTKETWKYDEYMSRYIGGLAPIARRDKKYNKIRDFIYSSMSKPAIEIYEFHCNIREEAAFAKPILKKFTVLDKSFPMKIRLGKWLVLQSVLSNRKIDIMVKSKIVKTFSYLTKDKTLKIKELTI